MLTHWGPSASAVVKTHLLKLAVHQEVHHRKPEPSSNGAAGLSAETSTYLDLRKSAAKMVSRVASSTIEVSSTSISIDAEKQRQA
jgi:hypothetical protein